MILVFGSMSKSTRYYWVSIHYNYHVDTDALTWTKYAWMLNLDHEQEKAKLALQRAREIATTTKNEKLLQMLEYQSTQLAIGKWEKFR